MSDRPGCIRFDDDSPREDRNIGILNIGLGLILFGAYGCEPKHHHHQNPLHRDFKLLLAFGGLLGMVFSFWLRGKRPIWQFLAGLVVIALFGWAGNLYLVHGPSAIPVEFFFPLLVELGLAVAVFGAFHLLMTDDYLVIDSNRGKVFQHSQFMFLKDEKLQCEASKIRQIEVIERTVTHKGNTTVYFRLGITLPHEKPRLAVYEVNAGSPGSLKWSSDLEDVIDLAVAIASASGKKVTYPASFPSQHRKQPAGSPLATTSAVEESPQDGAL